MKEYPLENSVLNQYKVCCYSTTLYYVYIRDMNLSNEIGNIAFDTYDWPCGTQCQLCDSHR